jgi:hypothetical protein
MPKIPPFVELKHMFRDAAKQCGEPISARESHRAAQGFLLSLATDDAYDQAFTDDTGETAVKNVLVEYLRKFGSLRAPVNAA